MSPFSKYSPPEGAEVPKPIVDVSDVGVGSEIVSMISCAIVVIALFDTSSYGPPFANPHTCNWLASVTTRPCLIAVPLGEVAQV